MKKTVMFINHEIYIINKIKKLMNISKQKW